MFEQRKQELVDSARQFLGEQADEVSDETYAELRHAACANIVAQLEVLAEELDYIPPRNATVIL